MKKLYFLLFLLNLPILLISLNILSVTYDLDLYDEQFDQQGVYDDVGEALIISENLLGYFDGSDLNESYYSQRELVHLKEVKALLTFVKAVSVISILFFFFIIYKAYKFRKEEREVSLGLILGGLLTNLIVIALLYVSATFDTSFIKFHELFFVSDTWLLAPTTTLIRLFSQEFFFDMLFRIILQVALFANLLVIGGILIIYRVKLINITRKFKDKYLGKYK